MNYKFQVLEAENRNKRLDTHMDNQETNHYTKTCRNEIQ